MLLLSSTLWSIDRQMDEYQLQESQKNFLQAIPKRSKLWMLPAERWSCVELSIGAPLYCRKGSSATRNCQDTEVQYK